MPEEVVNAQTGATPSEMAAHEADTDAKLLEIMGGEDDDGPVDEVDDLGDSEVVAEDFDDPDDYDDEIAEAGTGNEPAFSQEDYADAHAALVRSGWTVDQITEIEGALGTESLVERGLALREAQGTNDATYSEAGRLRQQIGEQGSPTTPEEGQETEAPEADPSVNPGASDLTSLAEPVAKAIAEMDDDRLVPELTKFVQAAVENRTTQQAQQLQAMGGVVNDLAQELLRSRLGAEFDGDLEALAPDVARLSEAGYHNELKGLDRYTALVRTAHQLKGGAVATPKSTSTKRVRTRAGARPPAASRRPSPKALTEEQKLDRVLDAVVNGTTDVEKLKRMGS